MPISSRRFPPPLSVEETEARFIVGEHNGQALASHPGSALSGLLWPGAGILRRVADFRDAGDVTNCAMLDGVRNVFRAAFRRRGTSPKARLLCRFGSRPGA
jgi:hypothetical protein